MNILCSYDKNKTTNKQPNHKQHKTKHTTQNNQSRDHLSYALTNILCSYYTNKNKITNKQSNHKQHKTNHTTPNNQSNNHLWPPLQWSQNQKKKKNRRKKTLLFTKRLLLFPFFSITIKKIPIIQNLFRNSLHSHIVLMQNPLLSPNMPSYNFSNITHTKQNFILRKIFHKNVNHIHLFKCL